MERCVVSRELAERLKAAGYPQITEFHLLPGVDRPIPMSEHGGSGLAVAAPLTDELLEQLNECLNKFWLGDDWDFVLADGYYRLLGHEELPSFDGDKPADALADLWLWCHDNGYLEGEKR